MDSVLNYLVFSFTYAQLSFGIFLSSMYNKRYNKLIFNNTFWNSKH